MAGPLDELFPGLRRPLEDVPNESVHPRVLVLPREAAVDFMFVAWRDPGGARALHASLQRLVEAALLSELSRPATHLLQVPLHSLRFVAFEAIPNLEDAVAAFALGPGESDWRDAIAMARGEASTQGRDVPDAPTTTLAARVAHVPFALAIEERLQSSMKDEVFGAKPGALFARLNIALELEGKAPLSPRLASLDAIEALLAPRQAGVVRWIPSLCFQALCDAVAVVATHDMGREVQWAESAPDDEGVAPPPMIRVQSPEGWIHLPLGLELLRWCIMPLAPGESVPPLSQWLPDRLGA